MIASDDAYKARNRSRYESHSSAAKFRKSAAKRRYVAQLAEWAAVRLPAQARVLDIGGGVGEQARAVLARRSDVGIVSIDLAHLVLAERAKLSGVHTGIQGDMESLPFSPAAFDAVVFFAALHHSQYPLKTLKEARRALRTGGRLLLVEPVSLRVSWRGTGFDAVGDGVNFKFSLMFLAGQLRLSGFDIEEVGTMRIAGRVLLPLLGRADVIYRASDALDEWLLRRLPIIQKLGAVALVTATAK